ncbi:MAG: molybdenum cofactor guanylyltransferase [Sphingobium sp.]|nr:MAG: molybdenum cofactor guanylyltransferase [Sphingobium sp.]
MKILGAILAGGQSRRFGSDKALAEYEGRRLIDHVASALLPQVDGLVVAGRDWPDMETVADLPRPGMGPLAGLAGALDYARRYGYDAVLSSGCDILGLPVDLGPQLGAAPAIVEDLPLVGIWPTAMADQLLHWLDSSHRHSVYAFVDYCGARRIRLQLPLRNINQPSDLV